MATPICKCVIRSLSDVSVRGREFEVATMRTFRLSTVQRRSDFFPVLYIGNVGWHARWAYRWKLNTITVFWIRWPAHETWKYFIQEMSKNMFISRIKWILNYLAIDMILGRIWCACIPLENDTEVKPGRAGLVTGWVTAWEYPVSRAPFCSPGSEQGSWHRECTIPCWRPCDRDCYRAVH